MGNFLLLALFVSSAAIADEMPPAFKSPPTKYEFSHEMYQVGFDSTVQITDTLLIGDKTKQDLKYYFLIYGTNGHTCSGSGTALADQDGNYYVRIKRTLRSRRSGSDKQKTVQCTLRFKVGPKSAQLSDIGGYCSDMYCARRAYIGDIRFNIEGSATTPSKPPSPSFPDADIPNIDWRKLELN